MSSFSDKYFDALIEIAEDEMQKTKLKHLPIIDFKFVCCVFVWYYVLKEINVASKRLQDHQK